ncbi:MAG: hypothetical protein ACREJO_11970 [Phycisphaerales bacterium]
MTMHGKALRSRWITVMTLVVAVGAVGGCDRNDAASKAIEAAERRVAVLTGAGGGVNPISDARRKELADVLASMKPYLDTKLAGQARAANLIAAQATASLAEIDLADAERAERGLFGKIQSIRESAETWSTQSARAKSEESYDPAPQAAELDKQIAELNTAIAAKAAEKTALEKRLEAMSADAQTKQSEAKRQRDQAAVLQQQVQSGSATAGLKLVEDAVKIRRVADALDTEASGLQAQVKMLQPQVDQLGRDAASLERNKASLELAKSGLAEQQTLSRKSAGDARAIAQTASGLIDTAVAELKALSNDLLFPSLDKAAKGFKDAAAMATKAITLGGGTDANSAKLSAALYHQGVGEALLAKARALTAAAAIMDVLGASTPPLSGAAAYQSDAKAKLAEAEASIAEVKEAFGKAWAVYETAKDNSGVSDRFKARMEAATNTLKVLAGEKPPAPEPVAAAPATPDKPADSGDTKPVMATGAVTETAAKAWVDKQQDAMRKRDFDAMASMYQATASEKAGMAAIGTVVIKTLELDDACKAKFSKSLDEVLSGGDAGVAAMAGNFSKAAERFKKQQDRTAADYTYTPGEGGKLVVAAKEPLEEEQDTTLVSVDGTAMAVLSEREKQVLAGAATMGKLIGDLMGSLAADVKSGKIKDERAFLTQLTIKMAAMQGQMMKGARGGQAPDPNK